MSGSLQIENILVQVRSRLQDGGVKLWIEPYYVEGFGPVDSELEVSVFFQFWMKISDVMVQWRMEELPTRRWPFFFLLLLIFFLF